MTAMPCPTRMHIAHNARRPPGRVKRLWSRDVDPKHPAGHSAIAPRFSLGRSSSAAVSSARDCQRPRGKRRRSYARIASAFEVGILLSVDHSPGGWAHAALHCYLLIDDVNRV